jgi:hypothetical protein
MTTVHPMAFARIKRQLAADRERDPRKAPKDAQQAVMVEALVTTHLPHLETDDQAVEPSPSPSSRVATRKSR